MEELSHPQIGQRCHYPVYGFGTILDVRVVEEEGLRTKVTTHLRIEFDAGITQWKPRSEVELLQIPNAPLMGVKGTLPEVRQEGEHGNT